METWKPAIGCFSHVSVSDFGRIRVNSRVAVSERNGIENVQLRPERIMSAEIGTHGYEIVKIKKLDERKKFLVHRLVAMTFVPGYKENLTVNHIDGNKRNNVPNNLEWITRAENTAKQWASGLVDLRGEKHPRHKLKDWQVDIARDKSWPASILATEFNVSVSLIYKIREGRKR